MKRLLSVIFFIAIIASSKSATCTALSNGDWTTSGIWSCGHSPTCGDVIIIPAGITVTITSQINLSACSPTPANSPQIYIYGCLKFVTGNKLSLPCGSNVYIASTGSMVPGGGGGNSNYLEICTNIVWNAGSGTATGPTAYCGNPPCSTAPLPVEFIAFTGNLEVKVVFISWKTLTETNNSHYDIEKSTDGINFEKFISVPTQAPNGNSVKVLTYNATDNDLKHPLYYYRLKQVDNNGSYKYSSTISVKIYSPELKIYPNPNNGSFWIDVPTAKTNQKIDVKIYDQISDQVLNNTYNVVNDNITGASVKIEPNKPLAKGVYYAIINFEGTEYRLKLIVN